MKDWIRSPSPDGYQRPSATSPTSDELEVFGPSGSKNGPAFGIRRGVVGVNLPLGTRASAAGASAAAAAATPARSTGVGNSGPPSLKTLCLSIVFRNLHQVRDLGFMSFTIAKPILEQCQADQLAEILDHSPHLAPDADTLWKKLCFNDFVQIRKDSEAGKLQEPESWRKLYWRTVNEAEEHKAAVAERIKSRYATARAEKDDRKIRVSERPLIRLSSSSRKWTSGMYGVSNGGLGGNGRPGANVQGQGMLARAMGKKGGSAGNLMAGRKRKAGPVLSSGIGGGGEAPSRMMDMGDVVFMHAHKVKVLPRSTFGSPPRSGGSGVGASGTDPTNSATSPASSSSSSQQQHRRPGGAATPTTATTTTTTTTTRIVKTVVPSAKAVPPGGLDFFGNAKNGAAGTKSIGKKQIKNGIRSSTVNTKAGGGNFSSPPPPLPASSPPPAVVTHTKTVVVPRESPQRSRKEGSGGSARGQHGSSRVRVRGAVD
ncbi:hypothetical protein CF326_g7114 [Tilletia indica]|nr:hypothetical protein CF326_g7114 [Tilletia indica]